MKNTLLNCTGFQWDDGNNTKNGLKHQVTAAECEEIFFNQPLIVGNDNRHSLSEARFYVLGKTEQHRRLFLVCTVRNNLIRVISARDMSKKEREVYYNAEKNA